MHKRSITLIEILIGFALFSILATFLFLGYFQTKKLEIQSERLKSITQEHVWAYERLGYVFRNLSREEKNSKFMSLDENTLVFIYDNGIDRDPHFSSKVAAKLHLTSDSELVLTTTSLLEPLLERNEILLNHVESLCFIFNRRYSLWGENETYFPKSTRVLVSQKGVSLVFPFILDNGTQELQCKF